MFSTIFKYFYFSILLKMSGFFSLLKQAFNLKGEKSIPKSSTPVSTPREPTEEERFAVSPSTQTAKSPSEADLVFFNFKFIFLII